MSTITALLIEDHRRLGELLAGSVGDGGAIDRDRFDAFRAGLLRHIAIEEKLLFPVLVRERTATLRADHARIAALLAISPTVARCAELVALLESHDALEEGPDGIYAACEHALGEPASRALAKRAVEFPAVRVAAYRDIDDSWRRS